LTPPHESAPMTPATSAALPAIFNLWLRIGESTLHAMLAEDVLHAYIAFRFPVSDLASKLV
jgi:hypothetical protein